MLSKQALEYKRAYCQKHKDRLFVIRKAAIAEKQKYIDGLRSQHGCKDCGNKDYRVLQFDHIPGRGYYRPIGALVIASWDVLLREIERCEIVCANCHRIRTVTRRDAQSSDVLLMAG